MRKIFLILGILLYLNLQAQDSLNISVLYHWKVDTMPISNAHQNGYNEVWGFVQNGKEYAVIGSTLGTHIFDVNNPTQSEEVVYIPGATQGTSIVHRDYHDYNGYLYMVCDEGNSTLQIADLSFLPDSAPLVYNSNALFKRSHNIFIDSSSAKLYVCGGENQLNIYSLADPESPTLLVNCSTQVTNWNTQIGYLHDIYVRNDTAYCNAAEKGLFVVDFSDTQNPDIIGILEQYPHKGYNHSGWLSDNGEVYALADENHGFKIKLLDVEDLSDISFIDTIGTEIHQFSIPHNLIFKGDYLYVSYYHDGTYIWNTADPANSFIVGFYDTSTDAHATNYHGNWGVYPFLPSGILLASDMQNGLYVMDVSQAVGSNNSIGDTKTVNPVVVFPNPSSGQFNISIANPGEFNTYSILDIAGNLVIQGNVNSTITAVALPRPISSGNYILKLEGDTERNIKLTISH